MHENLHARSTCRLLWYLPAPGTHRWCTYTYLQQVHVDGVLTDLLVQRVLVWIVGIHEVLLGAEVEHWRDDGRQLLGELDTLPVDKHRVSTGNHEALTHRLEALTQMLEVLTHMAFA